MDENYINWVDSPQILHPFNEIFEDEQNTTGTRIIDLPQNSDPSLLTPAGPSNLRKSNRSNDKSSVAVQKNLSKEKKEIEEIDLCSDESEANEIDDAILDRSSRGGEFHVQGPLDLSTQPHQRNLSQAKNSLQKPLVWTDCEADFMVIVDDHEASKQALPTVEKKSNFSATDKNILSYSCSESSKEAFKWMKNTNNEALNVRILSKPEAESPPAKIMKSGENFTSLSTSFQGATSETLDLKSQTQKFDRKRKKPEIKERETKILKDGLEYDSKSYLVSKDIQYLSASKSGKKFFTEKNGTNWIDQCQEFQRNITFFKVSKVNEVLSDYNGLDIQSVKVYRISFVEDNSEFEVFFFGFNRPLTTTCWVRDLTTPNIFFRFPRWEKEIYDNKFDLKDWLEKLALAQKNKITLEGHASTFTSGVKSGKLLSLENIFVSVVACLFFAYRLSFRENESGFLFKQGAIVPKLKEKPKITRRSHSTNRSRSRSKSRTSKKENLQKKKN
eukprot:GHVP01042577.1.p1 GENE.GHVP01042577.1~~GHVP01042577.1.p1  ORF type:complete len:512 (+),score=92.09 GHVP01042577.1:34-1536(+)